MSSNKKIVEAFRKQGYRATPQRIAIARSVLRNKEHPSAEDVYEEVKRHFHTISLSTVYNTLHILRDMNMVNELAFNDSTRFDPNTSLHINLVCEACGNIIDLEDPGLEGLLGRISENMGFAVKGHRLDVYGICNKCIKTG
jgi:Fur family peroxide stress response transcriptional regulator